MHQQQEDAAADDDGFLRAAASPPSTASSATLAFPSSSSPLKDSQLHPSLFPLAVNSLQHAHTASAAEPSISLPSRQQPYTSSPSRPAEYNKSHPDSAVVDLEKYPSAAAPPIILSDPAAKEGGIQLPQSSLSRSAAAAGTATGFENDKGFKGIGKRVQRNKNGDPLTPDEEYNRKIKIRRGIFIAAIILGIMIAVIVPIGWVYWPRFPEIRVLNLTLAEDGTGAYEFSLPSNASDNLNYLEARIRLNMQVSIFNPNAYDLELERLDINANLNCNKSEIERGRPPSSFDLERYIGPAPKNTDASYVPTFDPSIGTGSRGGGLTFPSRVNLTFALNFTLVYSPDRRVGLLKDPAFAELLQVCGISRPVPRPARVSYDAVSTVKSLSRLGYFPRVSSSVLIRCPASDEQIAGVIDAVNGQGNQTIYEILQTVFGG
ncbi:hypothetical protein BC829DRAFT_449039 [Chytridium lagenaria]|nr:hypothetical protein BC829DRAFT_449039 [Chytridium lagenaria]